MFNIENYKDFADQGLLAGPLPPLFPDAGGLLPFGSTKNADYLNWNTAGSPDDWAVVAVDNGFMEFRETGSSLTEFLLSLLEGRSDLLGIGMFPQFKSCRPRFNPVDPIGQAFPHAP